MSRFPDFIVIGSPKSGTTSLFHYLQADDRFFLPAEKELKYFNDEARVHVDANAYTAEFDGAADGQRCGDITPQYSNTDLMGRAPLRIHEIVPDVRLVHIMREPIARTYSHYRFLYMSWRRFEEVPATFEAAMVEWPWIVDTSKYVEVIERYREFFAKEQFLFLFTEDLERDPNAVLAQVQRHVGLDPRRVVPDRPPAHRTTDALRRHAIADRLRATRLTNWALDRVPRRARTLVYRAMSDGALGDRLVGEGDVPPMLDSTRRDLEAQFAEPNRRLAEFLGRELPWSV